MSSMSEKKAAVLSYKLLRAWRYASKNIEKPKDEMAARILYGDMSDEEFAILNKQVSVLKELERVYNVDSDDTTNSPAEALAYLEEWKPYEYKFYSQKHCADMSFDDAIASLYKEILLNLEMDARMYPQEMQHLLGLVALRMSNEDLQDLKELVKTKDFRYLVPTIVGMIESAGSDIPEFDRIPW